MNYSTSARKALLSYFASLGERAVSTEEVVRSIPHVPKSTLYRLISQLASEGILSVVSSEGRGRLYRYQRDSKCPEHMHMVCVKCGKVCHLDGEVTERIESALKGKGFSPLKSSVIEGVCDRCREDS